LAALLSSDLYSSHQPVDFPSHQPLDFPGAPPRPGLALDYFFMRRRSTAIGERFWNVVARGWADFNAFERTRSARLFSRYQPYWTPEIFLPDDRAFYDELPDEFTVYRGQNGVELAGGGAFTLSEDVARRCALGRRSFHYADPTILSVRVLKTEIALAFAAREEEKVVLFPVLWNAGRLEARHAARVTH
jgi:hypothetical protein